MFRTILTYLEEAPAANAQNGGSPWFTLVLLVAMIAIFYFLIIRPQKKQEKQIAEMRDSLKLGDEIVTIGGIVGTVLIIKDDKLMIETGNDRTKITLLRSSVKTVLGDEEEPAKETKETKEIKEPEENKEIPEKKKK